MSLLIAGGESFSTMESANCIRSPGAVRRPLLLSSARWSCPSLPQCEEGTNLLHLPVSFGDQNLRRSSQAFKLGGKIDSRPSLDRFSS